MTKPRAVFLDALSLGPVDLAPLERHAELICWPSTPPELRLERLQGAAIAITNKIQLDGELLRQLPQLRLICAASTGTDQIDGQACSELGIAVRNAGRYSTASVVQVTPVVAIAPLVLIWAGLDHPERALVTLAVLVAFFPIFSGATAGLRSADPDLERLFALYGAGRWQRVVRLRLPSAVPFLLEGHKVGAGLALIGAVVAEFGAGSGGVRGLAWQILDAGNKLQTDRMIAALVVLGAMGVALHAVLEATERAGLKWWRGR